ncbi:MAG: PD-(D/E)XK nuclease family protein [Gemmatimonas sp.]
MHYTVPQLVALDERFPTQRKLLLAPSINFGRELLAALAHERGSWIGWEVATLATLAQKLALVDLAEREVRRASDVAVADIVNSAFDDVVDSPGFSPELAALTWSAGTRGAIADAILELRTANVSAAQLSAIGTVGVAPSLAMVLRRYEQLLTQRHLADAAEVFRSASAAFDREKTFALEHALLVAVPAWTVQGATRTLFDQLVSHGLQVLRPLQLALAIPPAGLVDSLATAVEIEVETRAPSCSPAMFCAGTTADEIREVVRRAVANGRRLDEIEVASTDRDTYGLIVDALCTQIGASCTSVDGISLASTRIGRALERWLTWIESDYSATSVRDALESGDWQITLGATRIVGATLSAELRRLKIGWGLAATERAAETLQAPAWRQLRSRHDDESDDSYERRQAARNAAADALASLLGLLLANAPTRTQEDSAQQGLNFDGNSGVISVSELAARTINVLQLVEPHGPAERATLQRVTERLQEVAAVSGQRTSVTNALAMLRQELANLRAWTNTSNTNRPRRATGGHIHLTNIDSAGATGRPLLFLVGLDADRTAGPVLQSPLLPDVLRTRLNERGAQLPTIEQRRRERAWHLAVAMAGSSSDVTLSYAIRDGADARESSPAPALLQVFRDATSDEGKTYDELRAAFGEPVSAIPKIPAHAIDARDVVFSHLADGALLLDGESLVRDLHPGLNRGLHAVAERARDIVGPYHGLVEAAAVLDPRTSQSPVSPSSLESLATCSLRWFYSTALNARPPEEPVFDAMVWLNVLERGSALHLIYERIVREQLHEQPPTEARRVATSTIVNDVTDELSRVIPAAGRAVRAREIAALDNDAQLFVNSEHEAYMRDPWTVVAIESEFGFGSDGHDATLLLDDGTSLRVRGRVDRVDRLSDNTLRLVDYKTGRAFELDTTRGAFDGGRKLQLAVYSPAVSKQFDAVVSAAEYQFPTKRGNGAVARADRELLDAAPRIVRTLLDDVAAGRFVATVDKKDCQYCNYAAICRTNVSDFGQTTSPRAEWAKTHLNDSPHFEGVRLRKRRIGEDE